MDASTVMSKYNKLLAQSSVSGYCEHQASKSDSTNDREEFGCQREEMETQGCHLFQQHQGLCSNAQISLGYIGD